MSDTNAITQTGSGGPVGIGGWLILPVIGLVLTPLAGLANLASYPSVFDSFSVLTGAQKLFIILELLGNVAITIVLPIILMVLLFNKRAGFPPLYIKWAAFNFAFIVADLFLAKLLFSEVFAAGGVELFDVETIKSIARGIILVVVWIPYMLDSRRVKNTFVQ